MQRAFIVKLELDPSASIQQIEQEMFDAIQYDFPEVLSVKAWHGENEAKSPPVEGEIMSGQIPSL